MEEIRTLEAFRRRMAELSHTLECGELQTLRIRDMNMLPYIPPLVMKANLSLVDIWEEKECVMITIENRFGEKCGDTG